MVLLFFDISTGEILLILIVAFLVFGPDKIPAIAKKIGRGMNEVRRASDEIKREINREANKLGNDLNLDDEKFSDIQDTAREIKDGVSKFGKNIKDDLDIDGSPKSPAKDTGKSP